MFIIKATGIMAYWCSYGALGEEWGSDNTLARQFNTWDDANKFIVTSRFCYDVEIVGV